ncbi:unnamed protein product [Cuscuta epithymum]|uniref:Reverse transcriptase zinc-binding domain-containing protein n=1 Tax=Cuscuta epithymum TaxID=186058 RepID=A0AAV0D5A3_9ASTE|nr:unnamed protein product [Cuscuta epithymum]
MIQKHSIDATIDGLSLCVTEGKLCSSKVYDCLELKGEPETVPHILFGCQFSGAIWSRVRIWIGLHRQMTTLDSSVKWIKKDHGGAGIKAKTVWIAFIYTAYWIWRVRNATKFDGATLKEEDVFARIK